MPDQPLTYRQGPVDAAQALGQPAVAAKLERRAVGSDEVQARDLVAGDVRERGERGPEDLLDVERPAEGRRHGVQDLEMPARLHGGDRPRGGHNGYSTRGAPGEGPFPEGRLRRR